MTHSNSNHATPRRQPTRGRPALRVVGTIFLIGIVTFAMLACLGVMYLKIVIIPNAGIELQSYTPNLTTNVYATNSAGEDQIVQTLYGEENRVWVEFDDIPQYMKDAAVSIEDHRFYEHNGVDWLRTARGVLSMFTGQDIQGGSTITQQLIKNLTTEDQVTVKRKVTEIFRALEFEKEHDKDEILEYYLNYIYLGNQYYGISTAARNYFDKDVSELTLAECASIIGITNNPSKYNPYGTLQVTDEETGEILTCRDFNKERQENILYRMYDLGKITKEEYDAAVAEELQFVRGEDEETSNVYSWYTDAVIQQVITDLQALGYSKQYASNAVYGGGLKIYTCMNPDVQGYVDAVYNNQANLNYTSSSGSPLQSAITIVDNTTGNVVAMAGGIGEKTGSLSFNRATRATRQPGSAFKPLSVYAPALEEGVITPLSTEIDSPYDESESWPINSYSGYRGRMSMTEALRVSCNTIAVKILAKLTPEKSFRFLEDKLHLDLVERTDNGKSDIDLSPLALGGLTKGVTTYDMAAAYSTFARSGTYLEPRIYTRVEDRNGKILLETKQASDTAMKESTAYYMTTMLQSVVESGTGSNAKFTGMPMAGKTGTTGTSAGKNDMWFVGYTPYYTAAIWTGYDRQAEEINLRNNPALILWKQVMQPLHKNLAYKDFPQPDSGKLVQVNICSVSGDRATQYCAGHVNTIYMFEESVPTKNCDVHTAASIQRPAKPDFNLEDPSTWPTDDPNFDPSNPETYPGTGGEGTGGEGVGGEGTGEEGADGEGNGGTTDPGVDPTVPVDPNAGTVPPG